MTFHETAESAITELERLRPDASEQTIKRNLGRIRAHLAKDYSGGNGLRKLGLRVKRTKNFVEFSYNEECDRYDVEFMIAVEHQGGCEVFDSSEAIGSNVYILAEREYAEAKEAVKNQHLQDKRDEEYHGEL